MKQFAETERLILREVTEIDEQVFFELDADPEVHRFLGNKPIKSMEEARETIKSIRQQYTENGIGRWAVIEKASGKFIGWAGLKLVKTPVNNHVSYYDLGYRFIKQYWGKGFATEAAKASLTYGFEKLGLSQIYAMAACENKSSNQVLTKTGFVFIETFDFDGILHNWYKITGSRK